MKIENQKVVTLTYDMYVDGEEGQAEELMEKATEQNPLTYCQGEGMMLGKFEESLLGKSKGDNFDFRIGFEDAYGEYDEQGVMELDKQMFFNGDGEFDSERVYVGNIIPMNTVDGQIVNAQVIEIGKDKVTIDLNHPLAGENLHFIGKILEVRDVTEAELDAIRHPHKCGKCHGCHGGEHEGCEGGCGGNCESGCEGDCKANI
ncbi:MAG: FKBP-type peptidyl-prolyl cis-trans isomerase [Paludibacteraceae bacterium]|nr:FKBP-type peptidyl-prolyl cis-trans isomerase [Paludibacteraceae bacterium]